MAGTEHWLRPSLYIEIEWNIGWSPIEKEEEDAARLLSSGRVFLSGLVLALELRRSSDVPRYCGGGVCRTLSLGNNSSITAERSRLAKYEISQNFCSSLTQMINFNIDVISSIISLNPFEIINMRERGSFIKIQSKDCIRQGEFEMCSCFAIDLKWRLKLELE